MAGTNAAFDPAAFRDAIHLAMQMGSPTQTAAQATFRWNKAQTFNPQDPAHRPYRWDETVVADTTPAPVVLQNVAAEYSGSASSTGTGVGSFTPLKVQLTILDTDYAAVAGADLVDLGGSTWEVIAVTNEALFSVDVYTIFCERR